MLVSAFAKSLALTVKTFAELVVSAEVDELATDVVFTADVDETLALADLATILGSFA